MAMAVDFRGEIAFQYWTPLRRRFSPDSLFFASGNVERELLAKQVAVDFTEDERHQLQKFVEDRSRMICCPVVGCGERLNSMDDFEDHYNARHTASCSVCSRVFPTSRLLNMHVSEIHDSFFQAKVARGYAMYECLVEGCGLKFKNYKARQQHLVDKHKFATSFEFFKKARSSKRQRQKFNRKQAAKKQDDGEASHAMDVEDKTIDGLVSAVSRLSTSDTTPSNVSFGRRHNRGFAFVPRSIQPERMPES